MNLLLRRALGATLLSVGLGCVAIATAHADSGAVDGSAPVPGLGMSVQQFNEAGVLATQAQAMKAELAGNPYFGWVAYRDGALVVIGDGAQVADVARRYGAQVDHSSFNPGVGNATAMKAVLEREGISDVTAVLETADGIVIGSKNPAKAAPQGKTAQTVARGFKKVRVVEESQAKALAMGGQGYALNNQWLCSIGFPGWDAQGSKIMISAGHCSGGKTGWSTTYNGASLGVVTTSMLGDQTSAPGTWGTDFLTVATGESSVTVDPKIDRWDGSFGYITGTASPVPGMPICKSGTTTHWNCGTVSATGWVQVDSDGTSRYVWSALSNANGSQGDSGGAWVTGNKAVGVTSSGGMTQAGPRTNAAILDDFFTWQPGAEVQVWLPMPNIDGAVTSATWSAGQTITGQVPTLPGDTWDSNKVKVVVTIDGRASTVPVNPDGSYQFPYAAVPGKHVVTVQAVSGRSTGPVRTINVTTNAPQVTTPSLFQQMAPQRIVDTRKGLGGTYSLAANSTKKVQITGAGGVLSAQGVVSAVLNVTVTNSTAPGHVIAWPTGETMPNTSSVNFTNRTVANMVASKVGADGSISIINNSPAPIDLVIDLSGYYTKAGATGGAFVGMTPTRFVDTRQTLGYPTAVPSMGSIRVKVTDWGVPVGATAVTVNLTVTNTMQSGHETGWSGAGAAPNTSSVNWARGETRANMAVLPVSADGYIALLNASNGSTDFIADISGYYSAGAPTLPGSFMVVTPKRVLETRPNYGGSGAFATEETRTFGVGVPANATAVVMNLTATDATADGHAKLFPAGTTPPGTSTVNFTVGDTVPNLSTTKLTNGQVSLANMTPGTTQYIGDLQGYFVG